MLSKGWARLFKAMMPKIDGDEEWKQIVTGDHPMRQARRIFRILPGGPRCKSCNAPFHGGAIPLMSLLGRRPSNMNPHFCGLCIELTPTGGAETDLSFLFADVRGSTGIAEKMRPSEFTKLMNRFYKAATESIVQHDGWIDKFVGDEVIGLFIPGFAGDGHAARAVHVAQVLMEATGHGNGKTPWIPIGIGVHTGQAFVGKIGGEGVTDVTAMGDAMNVAARLVSQAAVGEIVMSEAAYNAADLNLPNLEVRHLQLKGREQPIDVRVINAKLASANYRG